MCVDNNGSVPVQSIECPRQGPRYGWDVNQSRMGCMTEVKGGEVEEVDDQDDLRNQEMTTDEQHDECELEKVVENEVASDPSSSLNPFSGLGE